MRRIALRFFLPAALIVGIGACSKDSSAPPTYPQQTYTPPAAGLSAVPLTVTLGIGGVQDVSVSGGMPPYVISAGPNATAMAVLVNPDSAVADLRIMGAGIDYYSTAVTVKDNTPATPKTVTVTVTVN
jgi:hypothetical protein